MSSSLAPRTMQSVLIGSEYPVMDTLLFYFPKSSYCNLFRGVAECYAFSCFHDNVGLRDLPTIRHMQPVCIGFMKEEQEKKAVKAAESPHTVAQSTQQDSAKPMLSPRETSEMALEADDTVTMPDSTENSETRHESKERVSNFANARAF